MSTHVSLSPRDVSLLRLLSWTPATTALLFRAGETFDGDQFPDERRLRERLQALTEARIVRNWKCGFTSGGLQNYYKLTPEGYGRVFGSDAPPPGRAFFAEVPPSTFAHTFRLAEVIVEVVRACHRRRVTVERFIRENELAFEAGDEQVHPDCFFRVIAAGKPFHFAFEIDNSTESIDSYAANSIRQKLAVYHAYQDRVLSQWLAHGKRWERPRLRVVFLTQSLERAYHILSSAETTAHNKSRRLVYAAAHSEFVCCGNPLFEPMFLDHFGQWRSLIDLHPTAPFRKEPVRLNRPMASIPEFC